LNTDFALSNRHFLLRPVQPQDGDFLFRVYACTRADEMALVDWTDDQKAAFLRMQFNAQRDHYLRFYPKAEYSIIQRDATDIGRLIVDRSRDPLLLMDIALLPEYRNGGIGTALIKDLMDEAAGRNWAMSLHVETFNPARKLYDRLGFVEISEQGFHHEMSWRDPAGARHG
jgi:GNAT superfamily N-acetyltransferase